MKKIKTIIILSLFFTSINFAQLPAGTYSIGTFAGADFATISEAVTLIEAFGISGDIVFEIRSDTYNEQVIINGPIDRSSGSSTSTITFQSQSGNPADVIVTYTPSGSTDNFLIKINNEQYLEFMNMTLTLVGTATGNVVFSDNTKGNMTFDGNVIERTAIVGELVKLSGTNYSAGHSLQGLVFNDNTFSGGNVSLSLNGPYDFGATPSGSVLINGNTFTNSTTAIHCTEATLLNSVDITFNSFTGSNGLYYADASGFEAGATFNINDNTFSNTNLGIDINTGGQTNINSNTINGKVSLSNCLLLQTLTSNTIEIQETGNALYINNCDEVNLRKNKIKSENVLGNGIYVSTSEGGYVVNNFIQAGFVGIDVRVNNASLAGSGTISVYNNSVNIETLITNNDATSSALLLSYTDEFVEANYLVRNNILTNRRQGYAYKKIGTGDGITGNNNNFFTNGINIINYNGVDFSSFNTFKLVSGQEANSYNSDVVFTTYSDLHLISSPVTLTGVNVGVIDDIDGDSRPNPPYLGADQPTFISLVLSLLTILEGPYNGNVMNASISSSLPLVQPYSAPIHSGTESVAAGFFDSNTDIVDWIVIELRKDINTKGVTKAGFILKSSKIVDLDGTSFMNFNVTAGDYYIVVYHRNHLAAMSAAPITATGK